MIKIKIEKKKMNEMEKRTKGKRRQQVKKKRANKKKKGGERIRLREQFSEKDFHFKEGLNCPF